MAKELKGYTDKQNEVAEWIMAGRQRFNDTHAMLRTDKTLRGYATNFVAKGDSHWFNIVKYGEFSKDVNDLGGGQVNVVGFGSPGYTQVYHSRYGITIINTHRAGKKPNGKGHHKVIESA